MNNINWTRKELKTRAKLSFKRNYWACVAVALIISIFSGSIGSSLGNIGIRLLDRDIDTDTQYSQSYEDDFDMTDDVIGDYEADVDEIIAGEYGVEDAAVYGVILITLIIIILIATVVLSLVQIFLGNPILIGGWNFFYKNDKEKATFSCLGRGFKVNYLNVVKTCFFKDLKLFAWSLLLVVPGIIKSYEYRMIPFILAENPNISTKEAFEKSRMMMTGQKWNAFVLDLSFILWIILGGITLGLAAIFFVFPYICQTQANLYAVLKGDYDNNMAQNEPEPIAVEYAN